MAPNDAPSIVRIVFHPSTGNGRALARARKGAAALKQRGIGYELLDTSFAEHAELPALTDAHIQTREDSYADGEYVGTGNFRVRVIPAAIKLIC